MRDGADHQPGSTTVGEYLQVWLGGLSVAATTKAHYATCVRACLIPHLGHLDIDQLSPEQLDSLYRHLRNVTDLAHPPTKRQSRSRAARDNV